MSDIEHDTIGRPTIARDFDEFTGPEREAIKLARSVGYSSITGHLVAAGKAIVARGVGDASVRQLRELGACAFVLARRLDSPAPEPPAAQDGPNLISAGDRARGRVTDLTVRLTLNSDPTDVFDEAEQLVELKRRLEELASVEIVGIERTRR